MDDVQASLLGGNELRVLRPDGAGVHHGVSRAKVRRIVTDVHGGACVREGVKIRAIGAIGAGNSDSHIQEHLGKATHARPADPNEVGGADVLGNREGKVGSDHVDLSLIGGT